jgi:hypothetical protein
LHHFLRTLSGWVGFGPERSPDDRESETLMRDHNHLEGDGPSPNPSDDDVLEEMEEEIEDMDRPLGAEDRTTASEQREGDTMDERLAREMPDQGVGRRPAEPSTISEEDAPDEESELIGETADAGGRAGPEEAAMRIRRDAPGATDHPDDYVED